MDIKKTNNIKGMITKENIDQAIYKCISRYNEMGHYVDSLFWSTAIDMLQEKYKFKLEEEKDEKLK